MGGLTSINITFIASSFAMAALSYVIVNIPKQYSTSLYSVNISKASIIAGNILQISTLTNPIIPKSDPFTFLIYNNLN